MLLRCRDPWCPCYVNAATLYVTCCYAAEISGVLATLHVATLQRSLVSLLRYMLLRCRDIWCPCYVTCCYAAEISGFVATLHVATLQRSLVSLLRYMLLRCRDLWCPCYVTCCYAADRVGVVYWRIGFRSVYTSSTAQGGGGSFKNRKPIGEVGCCESGMAERIHWWTERSLRSPLFRSLSLTIYLPTYLSSMYLSIYLSIYLSLSLFHLSICLPVYLCCSVIQCNVV